MAYMCRCVYTCRSDVHIYIIHVETIILLTADVLVIPITAQSWEFKHLWYFFFFFFTNPSMIMYLISLWFLLLYYNFFNGFDRCSLYFLPLCTTVSLCTTIPCTTLYYFVPFCTNWIITKQNNFIYKLIKAHK